MGLSSGRSRAVNQLVAPLLFLIAFAWQAAAAPPVTEEGAYRAARSMIDRGEFAAAKKAAETALAAPAGRDPQWTCAWQMLRAEILVQQSGGADPDAPAILKAPLPPACATSEAAVRRLLVLAYLAAGKGDGKAAEANINEALALAEKHQPKIAAELYLATAMVGNAGAVETNVRKAIALARKQKNKAVEGKALAVLSRKLIDKRQYAEAISYGEQSIALTRQLGLKTTTVRTQTNLAWAFVEIGDYERAAEFLATNEVDAARYGLGQPRMAALQQLGNVAAEEARNFPEAIRRFLQALEVARTIKDAQDTTILANLAAVYVELHQLDRAREFNAEAIKRKREIKDEEGLLSSRLIDARIAFESGQTSEAEALFREVAAAAQQPSVKWEAQARLATVYSKTGRKQEAEKQFGNAIRTAGLARKSITSWPVRLSFSTLFTDVFSAYLEFLIQNNRGADALAATEAYRAQTLEEGLAIPASVQALDARSIARQVHATILCYWLGPEKSYLWVVNAAGIDLVKLPSGTKINAELDAYQRQVSGARGTLPLLASRGESLYKTLIAPAGPLPRNSRVIIVPDGKLHAVNLETLVVPSAPKHFWIEDVVLSTAGSLQLIVPEKKTAGAKMLVVGNPPTVDRTFPPLPKAADEIAKVASQFKNAKLLTGKDATPAAYTTAAPGTYDYLHFVAHGVATRETPLDSAVILGMDASKTYRLLASEIVKTPLNARLVTISSCYGAGSRNYAGEGLVGLAWAFLRAGADEVIAALWEVSDNATPALMHDMYAGIRSGHDPAVALRDAKLKLVHSGNVSKKPSYWAPFVLYTGR